MNLVTNTLAVAATGLCLIAGANAQEAAPQLNFSSTKAMADGCLAFARENGLDVTMAIRNSHDTLVLFQTMDGASLLSHDIAKMKAHTAVGFRRATKEAAAAIEARPALAAIPGVIALEGGEAIFTTDGAHLGGFGVSGATSAEDAACARAGIAAAGLAHAVE